MGQLAQLIARYGVVMGKAMYEAAKKGIDLFKKPTISDKRRKVLDKQRKEYEADEKAGIKAGNKLSDADLLKKLNAQKDKALKDKKIADRADKIVEKKEKGLLSDKKAHKSVESYRKKLDKDSKWKPSHGRDEWRSHRPGTKQFTDALSDSSTSKHLLNTPAAATALVGTTASLISKRKNKSKKKGT